jgi:hypothetical protein
MKDVNTLTGLEDGKTMQKIDPSSLDNGNTTSSTSNFSYSIWFFIDDWNYRFGEPKVIFGRMSDENSPCPLVVLGANQNNIITTVQVYPGSDNVSDTSNNNSVVHTCNVANIPLQKWVNLIISAYGRSLDVYIDGKLVKTCLLPGVASVNNNADVYVTPSGGFEGWTAKLQYYPGSLNPQEVWNLYSQGYSDWTGMFSAYRVKISLVENGNTQSSITI